MEKMSDNFFESIYNNGERLIPGLSHDHFETVRHFSSYHFFKKIIELDMHSFEKTPHSPIRILDIGCGVGHGCYTLSLLDGVNVTGIDVSLDTITFAKQNYAAKNIEYYVGNIADLAATLPVFDYIVSRNAIEHVSDGLNLLSKIRFNNRLIFDIPYAEPENRNPYHVLTNITEKDFEIFDNHEIFFQDLSGTIFSIGQKPELPNVVICAKTLGNLLPIEPYLSFPFQAWDLNVELENFFLFLSKIMAQIDKPETHYEHTVAANLLEKFETLLTSRHKTIESILNQRIEALKIREASLTEKEADVIRRERMFDANILIRAYRKFKKFI